MTSRIDGRSPSARPDPPEQARGEIERARAALGVVPELALSPGWIGIAETAASLPESARAGFLSHHAFDVECTEALLALPADELDGFPPALSQPPACAAFLQFLALSGWHQTLEERDRLKRAIEAATYLRDFDDRERFRARLPALEAKLLAPAIPDGWLTVPGLPRAHCSLRGSTDAYRAIAAEHRASSSWVLGFGHPFSLWLAARDAYETAFERSDEAGKWDVAMPSLEAAARVAVELVPAFERGLARLGKILLCEAVVGGTAIVLYASRPDDSLRRVLESAAGAPAFYVHDSDCGEGAALRRIVRLASRLTAHPGEPPIAAPEDPGTARPDLASRMSPDSRAARPDLASRMSPDSRAARPDLASRMSPDSRAGRPDLASRMSPDSRVARPDLASRMSPDSRVARPDLASRMSPDSRVARPDLAARIGSDFGAAIEMSDVQRRILRTALEQGVTPVPRDCWSRLVLTYLDGLADETAALPAALSDPARLASIAAEALALQHMERKKTGIAPRTLAELSAGSPAGDD